MLTFFVKYQRPPPVFIQLKNFRTLYTFANIIHFVDTILHTFLSKWSRKCCHETFLGLYSFHLASKHDHVHIFRILMSSKLCNWTSSFDQALYLSVVKYLLSINATDNCVPCSNFIVWIPKGKEKLQTNTRTINLPFERDYKNYDRRLYFCESAVTK